MAPPPPPPPPPPQSAASATLGGSGRSIPIPDASSCHHCHIHAPIPARDLKRTHPLRSSFTLAAPKIENDFADTNNDVPLNFMKNVSFLYRKIHKNDAKIAAKQRRQAETVIPPLPPTPPVPPRHSTTTLDNQPVVVLDSLPPLPPLRRRRRPVGIAGLQAAVLIGAYALLLVLAVVIGVVLTQSSGRRGRERGSPVPRRPVFQGAALDQGPVRIARPRHPQAQGNRIGRPRQQGVPLPPPPPPPRPTPAPTTTEFPDYDYVYVDEAPQVLLPNPVAAPRPPPFTPQVAPRRPAPQPAPRRPAPQPAPRRPVGSLASVDRDFNLEPEEKIRGLREPEVKILKSWSHQNADGTYTWGYVNTDGSFKNETKGLDCVVHGIYGYLDKDTGREVSFPYTSGNPCDPDAPDYYYDYDSNVMMIKEANGDVFSRPGGSRSNQGLRRQG